jgi:formylglycine-generating enzyme required for sulfatase activity
MYHCNPLPIIFLAFAPAGDLPSLAEEARVLREILNPLDLRKQCDLQIHQEVALDTIIKVFLTPEYRDRIAVFHYAGHADQDVLLLNSPGSRLPGTDARSFADFLGRQSGLQLVVLNGCLTAEQLPFYKEAGIPSLLGATDEIADTEAHWFAEYFYRSLAAGSIIQRAYAEARDCFHMNRALSHVECPWQLYLRSAEAGNWALPLQEPQHTVPFPVSSPLGTAKVNFDWVSIPRGNFLFGEGETARSRYVSDFAIGRTPVTNAQYQQFVTATGCAAPSHWYGAQFPPDLAQHPVVNVSLLDAQHFCTWAGVRLPTELEWEKAARGTDGRTYPWGSAPPAVHLCNANRTRQGTTPVAEYLAGASPYGCMDMAGNVWEWTSIEWSGTRRRSAHSVPPLQPRHFIVRGGSFQDGFQFTNCSARLDESERCTQSNLGFRVARSLPKQPFSERRAPA